MYTFSELISNIGKVGKIDSRKMQGQSAFKSLLSRYVLCFHYQITSILLGSVRPPKKSEMRFFLEDNGHELPNARWVSTGYLFSEHVFFSMK